MDVHDQSRTGPAAGARVHLLGSFAVAVDDKRGFPGMDTVVAMERPLYA